MRVFGGVWRGRRLISPAGEGTRPTADRVRQAVFDILLHASWGGGDALRAERVLDAFAGTGAFGLEALSRGAGRAVFVENDTSALTALRANIAKLGADQRCEVLAVDVRRAPSGYPSELVFLDPPYGQALAVPALTHLRAARWIVPGTIIVVETARSEPLDLAAELLAERSLGPARLSFWRSL